MLESAAGGQSIWGGGNYLSIACPAKQEGAESPPQARRELETGDIFNLLSL
jgi:hypothetical protein